MSRAARLADRYLGKRADFRPDDPWVLYKNDAARAYLERLGVRLEETLKRHLAGAKASRHTVESNPPTLLLYMEAGPRSHPDVAALNSTLFRAWIDLMKDELHYEVTWWPPGEKARRIKKRMDIETEGPGGVVINMMADVLDDIQDTWQ